MPEVPVIQSVSLVVNDLKRCTEFYVHSIGLQLRSSSDTSATLGTALHDLLHLHEDRNAPRVRPSPGLYHVAYLVPSRTALARQLRHFAAYGVQLQGMSDHLVSEALYLADPEGNGIEIYRDRPRKEWAWHNGQVDMATIHLDVNSLMSEPEAPFEGMPPETIIGHIHLRVSDLDRAEAFYTKQLGFDVTTRSYPGALFLSYGGYHHHIGLNTWGTAGAPSAPAGAAGLQDFTLAAPSTGSAAPVSGELRDPDGIQIKPVSPP